MAHNFKCRNKSFKEASSLLPLCQQFSSQDIERARGVCGVCVLLQRFCKNIKNNNRQSAPRGCLNSVRSAQTRGAPQPLPTHHLGTPWPCSASETSHTDFRPDRLAAHSPALPGFRVTPPRRRPSGPRTHLSGLFPPRGRGSGGSHHLPG